MRSLKSNILVFALALSLNSASQSKIEEKTDWDILIFAQQWPGTMCKSWKQDNLTHHCRFPSTKNRWSVHGIWPAKLGNESYPSFCNDTLVFDPEQIKSIEQDLEQAWINIYIETSTYKFWAHEWEKHGTCGLSIKDLNSQLKYFSQGIYWNKKYDVSYMLSAANIMPSNVRELSFEELGLAVQLNTSKQPTFLCWWDNGVQYLEEILVCFDKQLKIIDCLELFDTCDTSKGLIYPI